MIARTVGLIGVMVLLAHTPAVARQDSPTPDDTKRVEVSETETKERVKADVAARLRIDAAVRTIESGARTWPDAGLGCNARRGVFEPMPVPGFRIVAEAQGRRFVYHTDRFGRLLRCATPAKPLGPIR